MEILKLNELIGRTIIDATAWSDKESMSLVLDNGGILQISANEDRLHWEVEFAPPTEGEPHA